MLNNRPDARVLFIDLPESLKSLALGAMDETVAEHLGRPWTDDRLCRDIAVALDSVGWVQKVNYVRRTPDARILISCRYRTAVAMVQSGAEFKLIDGAAIRLPGSYRYDPTWGLIQGVASPAPAPGRSWPGSDLRAGLTVLAAIENEPFAEQITAVLVDNFEGRKDPLASHLELATDRAGGRIRWGSAPGHELEENSLEQKVALLRENYRQTGRADAHHLLIDVSIFPDRYLVPG